MKYTVIALASLITFSSPALAAPLPVASPENAAKAADNQTPWTAAQIEKLCRFRAAKDAKNPKRYDICMGRHKDWAGKGKKPNDITELNAADVYMAKQKATAKTAAGVPAK